MASTATGQEKEFKEPEGETWEKSNAKAALERAILDGRVPLHARDENGKSTMKLREIYEMLENDLKAWDYKKLSGRLSSFRATVQKNTKRRDDDRASFDLFVARHPPSLDNKHGLPQYNGSEAQAQILQDIVDGKHTDMTKSAWYHSHPVFYENMLLKQFRDCVKQELETAKYLHTLRVKGKLHKAS